MEKKNRSAMMNDLVMEMTVYRPHVRRGQAMFIVLNSFRPDLASEVAGTPWDPFYRDDRIESFLIWLGAKLKLEQEAEEAAA